MLRALPDGSLYAPQRGQAPECPVGYERDSGNPFVFRPILEPCQYRAEVPEKCNCGTNKFVLYCNNLQRKITKGDCKHGLCKRVIH